MCQRCVRACVREGGGVEGWMEEGESNVVYTVLIFTPSRFSFSALFKSFLSLKYLPFLPYYCQEFSLSSSVPPLIYLFFYPCIFSFLLFLIIPVFSALKYLPFPLCTFMNFLSLLLFLFIYLFFYTCIFSFLLFLSLFSLFHPSTSPFSSVLLS